MTEPRILSEKIWDQHLVRREEGKPDLLYIDLHLVHEVTSAQAFESMRMAGRDVRRPELTLATVDHNVPTVDREKPWADQLSVLQVKTLRDNCAEFGVTLYDVDDIRQGIVHVVGPEQGLTQPGMTIVCGDSHTSTHGALGALAFGIGTSEVEHVLSTQTLPQGPQKTMAVEVNGELHGSVTAKDVVLAIIRETGVGGGVGHIVEYRGEVIRNLSMAGRLTVCNMTIEGGARAGLVAPDDITFEYLEGRPAAPKGADWETALDHWRALPTDEGATFDKTITMNGADIEPCVTWGTTPAQSVPITGRVPDPDKQTDPVLREQYGRALEYMGLKANTAMQDISLDKVFIGSCTNSRIEDLRAAAEVARGKTVAKTVSAMVVPGSGLVKAQAEEEGLDKIFTAAGFEWREAGCSMCLGMNPDFLLPKERCASTSNRNFEGRQGPGGRTHLVSPAMAAAAAIAGHFVDIRDWE